LSTPQQRAARRNAFQWFKLEECYCSGRPLSTTIWPFLLTRSGKNFPGLCEIYFMKSFKRHQQHNSCLESQYSHKTMLTLSSSNNKLLDTIDIARIKDNRHRAKFKTTRPVTGPCRRRTSAQPGAMRFNGSSLKNAIALEGL